MNSFQDIVQYLVCGQNPVSTIREIADVMAVAPPTVYGYKNQGCEPKFSQILALNNYLVQQKNCHVIENIFKSNRDGKTNDAAKFRIGKIKKELTALEAEIQLQ